MNPAQNKAKVSAARAAIVGTAWDNRRAQFGPDRSGGTPQPGPDLSASLDTTEEH